MSDLVLFLAIVGVGLFLMFRGLFSQPSAPDIIYIPIFREPAPQPQSGGGMILIVLVIVVLLVVLSGA